MFFRTYSSQKERRGGYMLGGTPTCWEVSRSTRVLRKVSQVRERERED